VVGDIVALHAGRAPVRRHARRERRGHDALADQLARWHARDGLAVPWRAWADLSRGGSFLRSTLMNPLVESGDLAGLVEHLRELCRR
jgi:hypothetical protein